MFGAQAWVAGTRVELAAAWQRSAWGPGHDRCHRWLMTSGGGAWGRQVRRPCGRSRARWRAGAPAVPPPAGRTAHRAAQRGRRPRLSNHRTGCRPHCRAVPAAAAVRGRLPESGSRCRGTARAALGTSGTGLTAGQEPGRQSLLLAWSPESQRARSRWAFSFQMASIWATSGWSTVNSRSKPSRATPAREPARRHPVGGLLPGTTLRRHDLVPCPQHPRFPSGTGRCSCRPPARRPRACRSRSRPRRGVRLPGRGR